jgi:hypothetical protein
MSERLSGLHATGTNETEKYLMILAEDAGIPDGRELEVVTEGLLLE